MKCSRTAHSSSTGSSAPWARGARPRASSFPQAARRGAVPTRGRWRRFCCRLTPSSAEPAAAAPRAPGLAALSSAPDSGPALCARRGRGRQCEGHRRRDPLPCQPCVRPRPWHERRVFPPGSQCRLLTEPRERWEGVGTTRGRLTRESGQPATLSAPPWTWPRAAQPLGCSERAIPRGRAASASGPRNPSAHGGDSARDLRREVTTARRREDLSEARRQARDHIQPNVTPQRLAPSLCFPRPRS